jgi:hypothetical protein
VRTTHPESPSALTCLQNLSSVEQTVAPPTEKVGQAHVSENGVCTEGATLGIGQPKGQIVAAQTCTSTCAPSTPACRKAGARARTHTRTKHTSTHLSAHLLSHTHKTRTQVTHYNAVRSRQWRGRMRGALHKRESSWCVATHSLIWPQSSSFRSAAVILSSSICGGDARTHAIRFVS